MLKILYEIIIIYFIINIFVHKLKSLTFKSLISNYLKFEIVAEFYFEKKNRRLNSFVEKQVSN